MTPIQLLELVGGIVSLATLLFAAYRQAAVKVWRDNYEAEKSRGDRLGEEVTVLRGQITELSTRVSMLTELVTGTQAISEFRTHTDVRFDKLELIVTRGM